MAETKQNIPVKTETKSAGRIARSFEGLRHEVDRLFEEALHPQPFGRGLFDFSLGRISLAGSIPKIDIAEKDAGILRSRRNCREWTKRTWRSISPMAASSSKARSARKMKKRKRIIS